MLEWFNKGMHDFNQKYITSSDDGANQFFTNTIPEGLRRGLANFFANLGEPVVAVSSLAQGDIGNARIATRRFLLNLVYGYGGVLDPASQAGIKPEPRDMGQAICSI
ncbi:MAG: MlaA family lipoprotein, partial [Rhodospirillaceae bacterium]